MEPHFAALALVIGPGTVSGRKVAAFRAHERLAQSDGELAELLNFRIRDIRGFVVVMAAYLVSHRRQSLDLRDYGFQWNGCPRCLVLAAGVFLDGNPLRLEHLKELAAKAVGQLPQSITRLRSQRKLACIHARHEFEHVLKEDASLRCDRLPVKRRPRENLPEFIQAELHSLNANPRVECPRAQFDEVNLAARCAMVPIPVTPRLVMCCDDDLIEVLLFV